MALHQPKSQGVACMRLDLQVPEKTLSKLHVPFIAMLQVAETGKARRIR